MSSMMKSGWKLLILQSEDGNNDENEEIRSKNRGRLKVSHQLALTASMSLTKFWAKQIPKICREEEPDTDLMKGELLHPSFLT